MKRFWIKHWKIILTLFSLLLLLLSCSSFKHGQLEDNLYVSISNDEMLKAGYEILGEDEEPQIVYLNPDSALSFNFVLDELKKQGYEIIAITKTEGPVREADKELEEELNPLAKKIGATRVLVNREYSNEHLNQWTLNLWGWVQMESIYSYEIVFMARRSNLLPK